MRRKEKEIIGKEAIAAVIKSCQVCRLALIDGNYPYVVPLNFGFEEGILYFHGAMRGKKLSLLQADSHAAFEMDTQLEVIESEDACDWSMKFQSIVGRGRISMIESPAEKKEALAVIMAQYSDKTFEFPDKPLSGTAVYKLTIEEMTGKEAGMAG